MNLKQAIGCSIYYAFARFLPSSTSIFKLGKLLRRFCACLMLKKHGKHINIERGAVFSTRCEVGDNSGIGKNCNLYGRVIIGNNVMMGPDCKIFTTNHKFDNTSVPMIVQGTEEEQSVVIGDDVWIGANVIILPGVHIAEGCVIGAGSVVTKSTEPFTVCCGNPAIVKKHR